MRTKTRGALRLAEVAELARLSPRTIRAAVKRGTFPEPLKITKGRLLWSRAAVAKALGLKVEDF
jgi:predicted DNA-binding transcriptional regulator AlpA